MQIIIHRVNTVAELKEIPAVYGVEVDVRGCGGRLMLSHDPIVDPALHVDLEVYLEDYRHAFIILNLKEAGYERRVLDLVESKGIENCFLLDVEFPYFYRATRMEGERRLAVRYSEAEPIEFALAQMKDGCGLVDWIWIDTNSRLPLEEEVVQTLAAFKTCLVCPERWGRPWDIESYKSMMRDLEFWPDAVMTSMECAKLWLA